MSKFQTEPNLVVFGLVSEEMAASCTTCASHSTCASCIYVSGIPKSCCMSYAWHTRMPCASCTPYLLYPLCLSCSMHLSCLLHLWHPCTSGAPCVSHTPCISHSPAPLAHPVPIRITCASHTWPTTIPCTSHAPVPFMFLHLSH